MKKFMQEFKAFVMRGNVIDLAIAVIIGGAFQKIIASLVEDIIMPGISFIIGKADYINHFIALNGEHYESLAAAKSAQAITINYGVFLGALINFILMALVIFTLIKVMNSLLEKGGFKKEAAPATTKVCPFCKSEIDIEATRCPKCTSNL